MLMFHSSDCGVWFEEVPRKRAKRASTQVPPTENSDMELVAIKNIRIPEAVPPMPRESNIELQNETYKLASKHQKIQIPLFQAHENWKPEPKTLEIHGGLLAGYTVSIDAPPKPMSRASSRDPILRPLPLPSGHRLSL